MTGKREKAEDIIVMLRQVEVLPFSAKTREGTPHLAVITSRPSTPIRMIGAA